ncbi:MAG: hypothetical protein LBT38_08765 [Deltaproteobacteria bacterium]|jgi:hypothetical protein|nr:hypothetical protein [Deltaproteobacteria bacterium]
MSMGTNETLDSPISEPISSGVLATVSDAELLERLHGLGVHPVPPQTVDQKTTAKVEGMPVANTVQVDNNKELYAKLDTLCAKFDAKFDALDAKFNVINTKVEVIDTKVMSVDSRIKLFMWIIGLVALILMGIAVPTHFSLSNKVETNEKASFARMDALSARMDAKIDTLSARMDTKIDALIKTVSDVRVDIGKLQVFLGQTPVAEQQKSPAPAETK